MYIGPSDHLTSDLSWILFIKVRLVPQGKGGGADLRPKQPRSCFNCLEMGHLKANCLKLIRQYPLNNIPVDKSVNIV